MARAARASIQGATIRLSPELELCPSCGARLQVYKTQARSVISLAYGSFQAQEVLRQCPQGCQWLDGDRETHIHRSPFLAQLVAPHQSYGFDVLAKVGILRFLECRQRLEIQAELQRSEGLMIPEGTIQELLGRFMDAIRALHEDRVPQLRAMLEAAGGFVLHVDGTCEEGSQVHFACLTDDPEPIVLWSERIASENAIQICGVLREIDRKFGRPVATMQDLSASIRKAVQAQWPGLPLFYCHWHFLADIGKDLLGEPYQRIRARLRESEIRPKLRRFLKNLQKELVGHRAEARSVCQHLDDPDWMQQQGRSLRASAVAGGIAEWILSAPAGGTGRGFPFDLLHLTFYQRARRALTILDQSILPHLTGRTPRGEKLLMRLRGILHRFLRSKALAHAARRAQEANTVFTRLREALRLAAEGSKHGMNESSSFATPEEAVAAEQAVTRLRQQLGRERKSHRSLVARKSMEIVLRHLDKYWDGLFGHCLVLSDQEHRTLMVPRTNNACERFFRRCKRFHRRATGKKKLRREIDALPGHALLVFNLSTPAYVKLVCGTLDQLPRALADLAQRGKLTPRVKPTAATLLDRAARRTEDFPDHVAAAYAGG